MLLFASDRCDLQNRFLLESNKFEIRGFLVFFFPFFLFFVTSSVGSRSGYLLLFDAYSPLALRMKYAEVICKTVYYFLNEVMIFEGKWFSSPSSITY